MKKEFIKATKFQMLVKSTATLGVFSMLLVACSKDDGYNNPKPTQPPSGAGASVMAAAGDSSTIIGTINQFRKLLGDSLNTVPGKVTGRREVNWDAVPPAFTNANNFPFAFFNSTVATDPAARKRGLVLTNTGTSFRVDSTDFSEVDASYANQFDAFSKKRLFTYMDNNITGVTFKVPGTSTDAFVKGFGVIFSDVDDDNSTTIEYYSGNTSMGVFKVPSHPASGNFSFLGVNFVNAKLQALKLQVAMAYLQPA
jgi:hypothetical protein